MIEFACHLNNDCGLKIEQYAYDDVSRINSIRFFCKSR